MPLQQLKFTPGVNRESTSLANEGTWFEMDKVRFRSGYPEKIGGWIKDTGTAATFVTNTTLPAAQPTSGSYWGVARSMWNWITLKSLNLLALGTNLKYYIQTTAGGYFNDVTPIRLVSNVASNAFTTVNGSTTVIINDTGHGCSTGDFVVISGVGGAINGISASALNREFRVTFISGSEYSIVVSSPATSSGTTGAATFTYQLNAGGEIYTAGVGWGAGYWGGSSTVSVATALNGALNSSATTITVVSTTGFAASGAIVIEGEYITYSGVTPTTFTGCTRGVGSTAVSHSSGVAVTQYTGATGWGQAAPAGVGVGVQLRLWSEKNFGDYLMMNPRGGALYMWVPATSVSNIYRAQVLSSTNSNTQDGVAYWQTDTHCPSVANGVTVSDSSRFVIAFGCNDPLAADPTALDPMLVRWSDQEDYKVWSPASTNQAGSFRLSIGSQIVCHLQSRQEILIWTDAALYSMQYLGAPQVWGFNILGDNISIMGPNASATAANVVFWMGLDKFYLYDGTVKTLYCPLRQYIFGDINLQQQYQFFASTNEGFNEIWFFYCSANSTVIDRYVIYNHLEKTWMYGTMGRTAWLDSPLRTSPMAAGYEGQLLYHESGVDDGSTNPPSPIVSYVQSADFDIGDGHNYGFIWRLIPDVTFDGSYANNPEVMITMRPRQNPGSAYGPSANPDVISTQDYTNQRNYTVQQFTQIVYCRVRGRQLAFKISSNSLGVQWQLGVPRMDVRPDGRR